jgi:hypothetical protein
MAVKRELTISIAPDGTTEITTKGFKGADCEDELKPIEKALGTVKRRSRTGEFYEKSRQTAKTTAGAK